MIIQQQSIKELYHNFFMKNDICSKILILYFFHFYQATILLRCSISALINVIKHNKSESLLSSLDIGYPFVYNNWFYPFNYYYNY